MKKNTSLPLRLSLSFFATLIIPLSTGHTADATIPPEVVVKASGELVTSSQWNAEMLFKNKFGSAELSDSGVKLITIEQPENLYGLQANLLNQIPLKKGDTLFIRFAARSLKTDFATGVTKLKVGFSKASPPWDSSYSNEIGIGSAWQRFDIPFTCKNDFAAKEGRVAFQFGYPVQIAEIADLKLIRYSSKIALTSLPKTARYADPFLPEKLASEIARIATLRGELTTVKDPSPASGRTLYVAQTGNEAGDGSKEAPFSSIPKALAVVKPGETILVGAGTYIEPKGVNVLTSGTPEAWIKIKAAPGARPKIVSSNWSGFDIRSGTSYIEIEGFEMDWVADPAVTGDGGKPVHGSGIAMMYATHHIRVLNNIVHGYGTGGIISLDCDYLHIEGNVIYDCAKTSPYGGSAISLCRAFDFDDYKGYHNVVRGNIAYDNELKAIVSVESGGNGRTLTDGNGIIIDVFDRSRLNPLKPHGEDRGGPLDPYDGRTLVENNLMYDNGGRGIHIFRSSNVDVVNNTCYMNQKSADINAGEFTAIEGANIVILNNIAYGRKEKRGNTQDGSSNVIWANNLFYNVGDVLLHEGIVQADPQFVSAGEKAAAKGFKLAKSSPALHRGIPLASPFTDIEGTKRPFTGPIDLGVYQLTK